MSSEQPDGNLLKERKKDLPTACLGGRSSELAGVFAGAKWSRGQNSAVTFT